MNVRPSIWAFLLIAILVAGAAIAEPPKHRPPPKEQPHGDNTSSSVARTNVFADSESVAGAFAKGGAGGEGGAGGNADAFGEGGTGYGGSGGGGGTGGTSGGNTFKGSDNNYFSLSVGAPNIDGCIVGGSAGGGGDGGGGLIQWGRLNHDCFMDEVSKGERHIKTRATLKCGSAKVRRAIAYKTPRASDIEKTDTCIAHFTRVWQGEIDYLIELVTSEDERRKHELEVLRLEALLSPK